MRVALIAMALTLVGGCFYEGELNDRPSAEIVRLTEGMPLRGDTVRFEAVVVDPGDDYTRHWRADACADTDAGERCKTVTEGSAEILDVTVPITVPVAGEAGMAPTARVRVHLDVTDSHGAVARPSQEAVVDVGNRPPTLEVQRTGRELGGEFPEDAPIFIAARGADPEGDPVTVDCQPFPPHGSTSMEWTWVQLADPPTGGHEWRLVPDVPGAWTVRCTARDPLTDTQTDTPITVVADRPPCLGVTDPAPAPDATIVLDHARLFSVLSVDDDLDVYPAPAPDDPFLGETGFRWSIRPAGDAAFTDVDAGVAAIELDPARYAPGDRLDVRVELDDRRGRAIACDVDQPTCSLTLDTCLQRQTWRVEVR
ncbi:MAG TPA: hypothetical protein VHE35_30325 [Kofleriaceae bacterium]|nr:hypothetical protein [Kofleriaceae bacterium]